MMKFASLVESAAAHDVHALTHEVLVGHGLEHHPFRAWTGQDSGLHQGQYNTETPLGNEYHEHLKSIGWKKRSEHNIWEDDDPDDANLPAGTWANTHVVRWEHDDTPWNLETHDYTHHPDLDGLDGMHRHSASYVGRGIR